MTRKLRWLVPFLRHFQARRDNGHLRPARPDSYRPAHTRRVPRSRTSRAMTLTSRLNTFLTVY
jgi:hypothetical protein